MNLEFQRGAWAAFNYVLNYLNTIQDKQVLKKTIYHAVHDMRPKDLINGST